MLFTFIAYNIYSLLLIAIFIIYKPHERYTLPLKSGAGPYIFPQDHP